MRGLIVVASLLIVGCMPQEGPSAPSDGPSASLPLPNPIQPTPAPTPNPCAIGGGNSPEQCTRILQCRITADSPSLRRRSCRSAASSVGQNFDPLGERFADICGGFDKDRFYRLCIQTDREGDREFLPIGPLLDSGSRVCFERHSAGPERNACLQDFLDRQNSADQ